MHKLIPRIKFVKDKIISHERLEKIFCINKKSEIKFNNTRNNKKPTYLNQIIDKII